MSEKLLANFREITIERPEDKIMRQIRSLITSGQLKPGDKLPPERKLSERLGVGRSYVRDAIRKLEIYGVLKTLPQSGTVVAGLGISALEGLISNVLQLEDSDFGSLVETRVLLECESARLAAKRRTEEDLKDIKEALDNFNNAVTKGGDAVEEDLLFHLRLVEASKNSVLKSLMLIIIPDIIESFQKLEVCDSDRVLRAVDEHQAILQFIRERNADEAAEAMRKHLQDVFEYSQTLREGSEVEPNASNGNSLKE